MVVYQLYQFIKKAFYINAFLILKVYQLYLGSDPLFQYLHQTKRTAKSRLFIGFIR